MRVGAGCACEKGTVAKKGVFYYTFNVWGKPPYNIAISANPYGGGAV